MTGQFSDFLSAHIEAVAEALGRTMPAATDSSGRGPRQLLSAMLVALTAEDMNPLLAYYELDASKPSGIEQRIETAVTQLHEVRRVTVDLAASEPINSETQLALAEAGAQETAAIVRNVVRTCVAQLAQQLSSLSTTQAARGSNLSITMHELRRPLTILNSYGQLLSTGMLGKLPETALVAVEGITASTEMMVRMVNALAEVSRLEDPDDQLNFEVMSLEEIVNSAVEHVVMEAKLRDTTIEADAAKEVLVRGDRRRLGLALTNMLGNAVKHGPPGSVITIRAFADEQGAHFLVRDRGQGFPPEEAAHLFDKYFRSVNERQRKVPGSGLGLFIVRQVAERHGGVVTARSDPGQGAEFEMVIPVHPSSGSGGRSGK